MRVCCVVSTAPPTWESEYSDLKKTPDETVRLSVWFDWELQTVTKQTRACSLCCLFSHNAAHKKNGGPPHSWRQFKKKKKKSEKQIIESFKKITHTCSFFVKTSKVVFYLTFNHFVVELNRFIPSNLISVGGNWGSNIHSWWNWKPGGFWVSVCTYFKHEEHTYPPINRFRVVSIESGCNNKLRLLLFILKS